jgi:hypothetical protein
MSIINQESLAVTLDAINEAFFYGNPLSWEDKAQAAQWIAGLQGRGNSHAGFPLSAEARDGGVPLFTGEKLRTRYPGADVIGVEACRALMLLNGDDPDVREALVRAEAGLKNACFVGSCVVGECAHGVVALWRYLAVGGLTDARQRLDAHLRTLAAHRDGKGRWKRFPFYYTLLALSELDHPLARDEMRYAAPTCERMLRRTAKGDVIIRRRRALMLRVLERC